MLTRLLPLYVFLLPLARILQLYGAHFEELLIDHLVLPCAIAIACTAVLLAAARILLPSWESASAFLAINYVPFLWGFPLRFSLLIAAVSFLALGLSILVARHPRIFPRFTRFATAFALGLFIAPLATIGSHIDSKPAPRLTSEAQQIPTAPQKRDLPDIYYIVLDGYARADVLARHYGTDNSELLDFLESRGFFVADQAYSNYDQTLLSLNSTLNLQYMDTLFRDLDADSYDRRWMSNLLDRNVFFRFLRSRGYEIVTFPSGHELMEIETADRTLSETPWRLNEFDMTLIGTLSINELFPLAAKLFDFHRERIRSALELTPEAARPDRPSLVFTHVICPHPPFVFRADGSPRNPADRFLFFDGNHWQRYQDGGADAYQAHYREQLRYTNHLVRRAIARILAREGPRPVIWIQSDHGPGSMLHWESVEHTDLKERMAILLAQYWPDSDYDGLYESISPVNALRSLLNERFGTSLKPLEDRSYFSTWSHPYRFIDVTSDLRPAGFGRAPGP